MEPGCKLKAMTIRIIKHEAVPMCGSYELRFSNGRQSKYFYWEDIPGSEQADSKQALDEAKAFSGRKRSRLQEQRRFQIDHRRHQGGSAWQEPR